MDNENKIIIILIVLLICGGVISYIDFNSKYSKSDVEKMCNSRVENKLNEICESNNGTCEQPTTCNCNCDYGYTGKLCNYKYLNNGDKFYTYNIETLEYYPGETYLEIHIDDNNQRHNSRLFLEKITLNNDPSTVKYKLTTITGNRFFKLPETTDKDFEYIMAITPMFVYKQEVLFSKTLLQKSSGDSKKNKFALTCKHSDTSITEDLYLCIYGSDNNYVELFLPSKIQSSDISILEISEDCFP